MAEIKGLGFIPSPEDNRDLLMSAVLPFFTLPPQIDYTDQMTEVKDQGPEGTCVAFATAVGMKEFQEKKQHNNKINLSPRFLYQECKKRDGLPGEGTYIRIAMDVLRKIGVCEEAYWPYIANHTGEPKPGALENAASYISNAYARIFNNGDSLETRLELIKRSLIVNGPFVAGVPVYTNWSKPDVWSTGKIPAPENSSLRGGHAICIVGYNDSTQELKFKNSWGDRWGDKGYGYLPYEYMNLNYSEAWSATDLIDDPQMLVRAKERVLEKLKIDNNETQSTKMFSNTDQKLEYH